MGDLPFWSLEMYLGVTFVIECIELQLGPQVFLLLVILVFKFIFLGSQFHLQNVFFLVNLIHKITNKIQRPVWQQVILLRIKMIVCLIENIELMIIIGYGNTMICPFAGSIGPFILTCNQMDQLRVGQRLHQGVHLFIV
jgi:hypothetical protein